MKKLFSIIALVLALCCLAGCAKKMPYEIVKEDGETYLVMDEEKYPSSNSDQCTWTPAVYFNDMEEMLNDFQTGNFTELELLELSRFPRNEEGGVIVTALDDLWYATYPEGTSPFGIKFCSSQYTIYMNSDGYHHIIIEGLSEKAFETSLAWDILITEREDTKIVDQYEQADRNATVYHYYRNYTDGKEEKYDPRISAIYTIEEGVKKIYVCENYDNIEEIPTSIYVYISDGGRYAYMNLDEPEVKPSAEWLSQFGMCDYE